MLIGNARVSKADGSQRLDLQRDALTAAGVETEAIYEDCASGKRDEIVLALRLASRRSVPATRWSCGSLIGSGAI